MAKSLSSITSAPTTSASPRVEAAEAVNRVMARMPLILHLLKQIKTGDVPFPGDDDLFHGCERALTKVLVELARIKPAPAEKEPLSDEEIAALEWLSNDSFDTLIDQDKAVRIQQLIRRVLP